MVPIFTAMALIDAVIVFVLVLLCATDLEAENPRSIATFAALLTFFTAWVAFFIVVCGF